MKTIVKTNGRYTVNVSFAGAMAPTFESIGEPVININDNTQTYEIAGKIKRTNVPGSINVRIDGKMNFSTKRGTATIHPIY